MGHLLVPLISPLLELLPIFGDVVIVQLKCSPSGSCIVTLREEIVIGIPVDPLIGTGFIRTGGLLSGTVTVIRIYHFLVY